MTVIGYGERIGLLRCLDHGLLELGRDGGAEGSRDSKEEGGRRLTAPITSDSIHAVLEQ